MASNAATADYLVVGAGSSGSVIVRRLLDAGHRVHVIEAGPGHADRAVSSPQGWVDLMVRGAHDWGLTTTPQRHANNRQISWPRGKVVGGSSAVNAMIYVRGHASDYCGWAEQTGDPGWSWPNALRLFKLSESNDLGPCDYHGKDGPLAVSSAPVVHPISAAFVGAGIACGHKPIADFNAAEMVGVGYVQTTTHNGVRASAWHRFVGPVAENPHLRVTTDAIVHRILIEGNRAVGVEYSHPGFAPLRAYAEGEVVLSAGAIGSPKVLLLSGIGPASHLLSVGIDCMVDLDGVGGNLHDHPLVPNLYEAKRPLPPPVNNLVDAQLFARSSRCAGAPPDLQAVIVQVPIPVEQHPFPEHGYVIGTGLIAPRSRGRLQLSSNDPYDAPLADPKMLSDDRDLEALVDAMQLSREIGGSEPLAEWRKAELAPGPLVGSRESIAEFVRQTVVTFFHPVGTCKMGAADDATAVVWPDLRVRGVDGLRVADASIMPTIPHGNTNAASIMIGERASELILGCAIAQSTPRLR